MKPAKVKMHGELLSLLGNSLDIGQPAPDFTLFDIEFTPRTLESFKGKIKVISVTPSVDTAVCNSQVHWFFNHIHKLSDNMVFLNVSADLPYALRRFCTVENLDPVVALSDHKDHAFGKSYGILIDKLYILARSVFIVDQSDFIRYIQIGEDQAASLDYEEILKTLPMIRKEV